MVKSLLTRTPRVNLSLKLRTNLNLFECFGKASVIEVPSCNFSSNQRLRKKCCSIRGTPLTTNFPRGWWIECNRCLASTLDFAQVCRVQTQIQVPNLFLSLITPPQGLLVEGVFTPTAQAQTLSKAPPFTSPSTLVIARFSVGGGIPHILDEDDGATPKGPAIRFKVNDFTHTDLISHSFNGFATNTGEDFLTFLQVSSAFRTAKSIFDKIKAGGIDCSKDLEYVKETGAAFQAFLAGHPSAAAVLNSPKPNPFNYSVQKHKFCPSWKISDQQRSVIITMLSNNQLRV